MWDPFPAPCPVEKQEFAERENPTVESALWVVWGLPEAQEEGQRLPWVPMPPEPALSPQERPSSLTTRAGPLMASSFRRAWSSSARPSPSCVRWPSAGSGPCPPPPAQACRGEGGQGQLPRGKGAREAQEMPPGSLCLGCSPWSLTTQLA